VVVRYLGFDGYRRGWVAAWIEDDGNQGFDYSPTINRLLRVSHERAMIDIPIGLPNEGVRECDRQARERLGPSVFVGVRRSLLEFNNYPEANRVYRSLGEPGISRQLWHIRNKIGEIDRLVTGNSAHLLHETHPELIFWSRNDRQKLPYKKSEAGRLKRVEILRRLGFARIEQMLAWRFGTGICRDDLIDACACAIAARDAKDTLGNDSVDACGLRMENALLRPAMPITIYGIKNCDTMKNARAWLDKHKVDYAFHDYKSAGIERGKLEGWAKKAGWETLLNRAGTTFKKLPDKDKENVTEKKAIALMLKQPSMIKRPVLELGGGRIVVGFKPEEYAKSMRS
jgi:Spx/MgsR family transcriptional regulator